MISPEQLRRFSLFAGLDPAVFRDLAMLGDEQSRRAGERLFSEGDEADSLYLITSGSVELTINLDETGTRSADITRLVEGDIVGFSAMVEPYHYSLGAVARTDTRLIRLNAAALHDYMENNPEVGYLLMSRLAAEIAARLTNLRIQFVSLTAA